MSDELQVCAPASWSAVKSGAIHRFRASLACSVDFTSESGDYASFVAAVQDLADNPGVSVPFIGRRVLFGVKEIRTSLSQLHA